MTATTAVSVLVSGVHRDVPADLHLVRPLPGLPGRTAWTLDALDEDGTLFALRSEATDDTPEIRLFVVSPSVHVPDYTPVVDPSVLGPDTDLEDLVVLVVVHPGTDSTGPTANLLAPVVIDRRTGNATQHVLDQDWPLRAPLG